MTRKLSVFSIMLIVLILGFMFTIWAQETMAQTSSLPIYDYLDDGAPLWASHSYSGDPWELSEDYRFGGSGMGWGIEFNDFRALQWERTIDLTNTVSPRLRFASNAYMPADSEGMAFVSIYDGTNTHVAVQVADTSGMWQEVVADLTAYKGQQIRLTWFWHGNWGPSGHFWMIDNVVVEDTAPATMTSTLPPNNNTVTAPPPVNNTVTAPPPNNNTVTAPPPVNNTVTPPPPPPPVNNTVTAPAPPPVNNTATPPPPPPVNNTATPPPPNDPTGTSPTATHTPTLPPGS